MAFDLDDLDPRHKKAPPKNLDAMSIEDLEGYIAAMKAEIEREMQELQAKRAESLAEMIDIDKIEGQVQASAVKRITEIVDKHPEEAAQVIRSWLSQAN